MESAYINIHSHRRIEAPHWGIQSFFVDQLNTSTLLPNSFSAGIHPWHINKIDIALSMQKLESLVKNPQMLAIGECGLDRAVATNFELQKEVFLLQLQLAEQKDKALIIHNVRAFSDFLAILKQEQPNIPLIFHAFNGNHDILKKLLRFNTYFSLGKELFDTKSKASRVLNQIPINRLFLETDEWEGSIEEIYSKASELLQTPISELRNQIYYTYKNLNL